MVEAPRQSENEEQKLTREAIEKERAERVKKIGAVIMENFDTALVTGDPIRIEAADKVQGELVDFKTRLEHAVPDYKRYKLFHFLSGSTPNEKSDRFDVEGDIIFNFANELVERFKLDVE